MIRGGLEFSLCGREAGLGVARGAGLGEIFTFVNRTLSLTFASSLGQRVSLQIEV